ncbi:MAG TPA: hypothetical protein PKM51_09215, partial [Chitinophagales bacterium]|nr:hypothetical protein [Chitinophagales bacterium]
MKKIIGYFVVGIISAFMALAISNRFNFREATILKETNSTPFKLTSYNGTLQSNDAFIQAA